MTQIRLGLVGIGKIARDQHLPAIAADPRYRLVATASRHGRIEDVAGYYDIAAMVAGADLDAVSLCTPPDGRYEQAATALVAGLHVMLEKPPAATVPEIDALADLARERGVTLFATWHSREAAAVAPARAWLADRRIEAVRIAWREDICRWHPGQEWILTENGFGVFDPGINALSILTSILPEPVQFGAAQLDIPEGRGAPIAATLDMTSGAAAISADFDFLQTGPQTWDIEVDTDAGRLRLSMGGRVLTLPNGTEQVGADEEYPRLYARFAELVAAGKSDVDTTPLRLVEEAIRHGARRQTTPFAF